MTCSFPVSFQRRLKAWYRNHGSSPMQDILFTLNGKRKLSVRRERHVTVVHMHAPFQIKNLPAPLGCGSIISSSCSILRFVPIPQRTLALGLSVLIYVWQPLNSSQPCANIRIDLWPLTLNPIEFSLAWCSTPSRKPVLNQSANS